MARPFFMSVPQIPTQSGAGSVRRPKCVSHFENIRREHKEESQALITCTVFSAHSFVTHQTACSGLRRGRCRYQRSEKTKALRNLTCSIVPKSQRRSADAALLLPSQRQRTLNKTKSFSFRQHHLHPHQLLLSLLSAIALAQAISHLLQAQRHHQSRPLMMSSRSCSRVHLASGDANRP